MKRLVSAIVLALAGCSGNTTPRDAGIDAPLDVAFDTSAPDQSATVDARYVMPQCSGAPTSFAPIATQCQNFVDASGRVVYFHGINARVAGVFDVTFDDGRMPLEPIPVLTLADTSRMRALGFDVLRLPVNWSAIEPTDTGRAMVNPTYMAAVHAAVDLARQAGLMVLIDFHQDAYSKEIGEDGAPLWAIQPPATMLLGGPLTDLGARRMSTQVLDAFATVFGGVDPGPELQRRFADMTALVAAEFVGDAAVVGYEVYNEPIAADAQVLTLNALVASAIRAVDSGHLIMFEPNAARNVLDRAVPSSVPFPVAGAVYSPHIYTLAFGGTPEQLMTFTRDTLRPSHASAVVEAAAWGTPMLVTEWGYGPSGERAADYFETQEDIQDEFGESDVFWLWKEESQGMWGLFDHDAATDAWTERSATIAALERVLPERVGGWPEWYAYDRVARRFELHFATAAALGAPSEIYVPEPQYFSPSFTASCDGATVSTPRDPATGLVDVTCGGVGEHVIVITAD